MQISGVDLLSQMGSTNSTSAGTQVLTEEATFQNALEEATKKLNQAQTGVMTDEEVAARNEEIRKASVQLEAIMLKLMYNKMWETVPKDTLFGDDNAMDIYRDMYHEELTKQMAEDGGIGLANFIYEQMTKTYK
mgnify:CR=1 FL=1